MEKCDKKRLVINNTYQSIKDQIFEYLKDIYARMCRMAHSGPVDFGRVRIVVPIYNTILHSLNAGNLTFDKLLELKESVKACLDKLKSWGY